MDKDYFEPKILRQMRREAGFYQKQLAEALGVSRETVLHIEKGKESSIRSLELSLIRRWYSICEENISITTKKNFAKQVMDYLSISELT